LNNVFPFPGDFINFKTWISKTGHFYHIYNRGNNSQKVFFNRENYLFFLRKMKKHISPFGSIISWCLMPNHFHLVVYVIHDEIEIENNDLIYKDSKKLKIQTLNQSLGVLLSSYTRAIQKQERITGSLFQKRTKAKLIFDEVKIEPSYWNTAFGTQINISEKNSYLETLVEYIHQNPVYSGLVKLPVNGNILRTGILLD
jgi:putative transposase